MTARVAVLRRGPGLRRTRNFSTSRASNRWSCGLGFRAGASSFFRTQAFTDLRETPSASANCTAVIRSIGLAKIVSENPGPALRQGREQPTPCGEGKGLGWDD